MSFEHSQMDVDIVEVVPRRQSRPRSASGAASSAPGPHQLPASLRLFFVGPLLEGLSEEEQYASIYCTQALMEATKLDTEERIHFDALAHNFKAADVSQNPSLTRVILRFIEKNGIPLERLHVSALDVGIINLFPRSIRVLVVTGDQQQVVIYFFILFPT